MQEYDRDNVARMFDEKNYNRPARASDPILELISDISMEKLDLMPSDILLDVGTGNGKNALRAARSCARVIGIDISRRSLETARNLAAEQALDNLQFAYGSFEDPSEKIDLGKYEISKVLATYSLHHLPDRLKGAALKAVSDLIHKPGRLVIGDLMFFEDPEDYLDDFPKVGYDGGESDFPASVEFLQNLLESLGARCQIEKVHPLAGVITADF